MTTILLVAVAGALGATARYLLDALISRRTPSFPAGTMIINITGSLLLGLLTGFAIDGLPAVLRTAVGAGILGGYTTFSTSCVETVRLAQERRWRAALTSGLGTLLAATTAAVAGMLLGRAL